jgi:hypothetical protein
LRESHSVHSRWHQHLLWCSRKDAVVLTRRRRLASRLAAMPSLEQAVAADDRCASQVQLTNATGSNIHIGISRDRRFRSSSRLHQHTACPHLVSTSYTRPSDQPMGATDRGLLETQYYGCWVVDCPTGTGPTERWASRPPCPTRPAVESATTSGEARVQRRDRLGGVLHEYFLAA